MPKLTILRGISGSGKSTWARQQNAVVVSRDDIRHVTMGIDPDTYYDVDKNVLADRESMVTRLQDAMVSALLRDGRDVIVDNTNIEWKYVKALAKIGYRYGADVEVKVFDVDVDTALRNVNQRANWGGRSVGGRVIEQQHSRFKMNKSMTLDTPGEFRTYEGTPGKPKAFLFDLDGTVYHMNGKRGPYDHNVDVDDPDKVIQGIVNSVGYANPGWYVIAMSGRKEATREVTEKSLERDGVIYDALFMRRDDDNRADNQVKYDLFNDYIRDNYDVQFVLDDRDQVVEMWRRLGLKTLQVEPGDF